jgi:hypothetical protein
MLRVANHRSESIRGVLVMRLERNVSVDGRTRGRMTVALPLLRNGAPRMIHPHVVPTGREVVSKTRRGLGCVR